MMSPLNSARTLLKTPGNDAVSKHQNGGDRIPPQETDDAGITSNNEHGEDLVPVKKQETQDSDKD